MKFSTAMLILLSLTATVYPAERPNVLIVLVDDMGFSDLGCYGSEIETPNIDRLAANGLRFSQFYNTGKCHSSRVSLLTGSYCYQAGNTSLSKAVTSAEVLSRAGYFTMMTGKWHLQKQPTDFGFDRYFGHLSGACNYYLGDNSFRLNGEPWRVPEKGFYTTVANVDFAIKFLEEARKTGKPWYLYIAFNAPHAPLQPLEKDYRKYLGRYDVGWDVIREKRLKKQEELRLFGKHITPSPRPDHIPAWKDLPPKWQDFEKRRMAAIAGIIDRVDQEMGRLIDNLKKAGELENTFILFVSDNGACPYDRRSIDPNGDPYNPTVKWSDSTGWAWVRNSPFRYYKQNQFEGGICTPAIVHWPAGLKTKPGTIIHEPAHLIDVLPTLAEIAHAPIPTSWPKRNVKKCSGISLVPIFNGKTLNRCAPLHFLFSLDRALRDGEWKAVSFRSQPWELYNISSDRAELNNLAAKYPERLAAMIKQWHEMAENVLEAPIKVRQPVSTESTTHIHPEWSNYAGEPGQPAKNKKARGKIKSKPARKKSNKAKNRNRGIRARKNTSMHINGSKLELTCTGTDSGIAIDHITKELPNGPYLLTFRLMSQAGGSGEIYFTTDPRTKLPSGKHIPFTVRHDGQWQSITLKLDTFKQIYSLRIDPCSQQGKVIIDDLRLKNIQGETLISWAEE